MLLFVLKLYRYSNIVELSNIGIRNNHLFEINGFRLKPYKKHHIPHA